MNKETKKEIKTLVSPYKTYVTFIITNIFTCHSAIHNDDA